MTGKYLKIKLFLYVSCKSNQIWNIELYETDGTGRLILHLNMQTNLTQSVVISHTIAALPSNWQYLKLKP